MIGNLGSFAGAFGGSVVGRAVVELVGDPTKLKAGFATAKAETASATGAMGKSFMGFSSVATAALAGAGVALGLFVAKGFTSLERIERINSQTAAAIKSTGGAANVTAEAVEGLAGSIERNTSVEAEAVQSGANMLLTFTNIRNEVGAGNDIFDQATKALVDMAVAMSGGAEPSADALSQSAIRLGKALNDPVAGATALRRVGVALTEEQRDQIKVMVEAGDVMGAQKIILAELTKEFGGSAEALGQTTAGAWRLFIHEVGTLQETLAQGLLPVFKTVVTDLTGIAHAMLPVLTTIAPLVPLVFKLGEAWLVFKALQFLPGLFLNAAIGLEKMGLATAASRTTTFAAGLQGIAGKLGLIAGAAAIAGPALVGMFQDATESSEEFSQSLDVIISPENLQAMEHELNTFLGNLNAFAHLKGPDWLNKEAIQAYADVLHQASDAGVLEGKTQEDLNRILAQAIPHLGGATGGIEEFTNALLALLGAHRESKDGMEQWTFATDGATESGGRLRGELAILADRFGETIGPAYDAAAANREDRDAIMERAKGYAESAPILHDFVTTTGQDWKDWKKGLAEAIEGGRSDVWHFVGSTRLAWNQWRGDLADSLNGVKDALQGFSGDMDVTAKDVIKSFQEQLDTMATWDSDWNTLADRVPDSAKGILDEISNMGLEGAGVLHALANANDEQFDRIMSQWQEGAKVSKDTATDVQNDLVGTLQTLINTIREAAGLAPIVFDVKGDSTQARADVQDFIADMKALGIVVDPGVVKAQFHEGGVVDYHPGDAPGLRPDERLIVAQAGEGIIKKRAMQSIGPAMLDAINRAPDSPGMRERAILLEFHEGGVVPGTGLFKKGAIEGGSGISYVSSGIEAMPRMIDAPQGIAGIPSPDLISSGLGAPPYGSGTLNARLWQGAVRAAFGAGVSFGVTAVRFIAGTNTWSQHAYGNAVDNFASQGTLSSIANWGFANRVPLHLAHLIWQTSVSSYGGPWHPYTGIPHTNHVHADFIPQWGGTPPGHPLRLGGLIPEPIVGWGLKSGASYKLGEAGTERVVAHGMPSLNRQDAELIARAVSVALEGILRSVPRGRIELPIKLGAHEIARALVDLDGRRNG